MQSMVVEGSLAIPKHVKKESLQKEGKALLIKYFKDFSSEDVCQSLAET